MTDLFADKAQDWDTRPVPAQISAGVTRTLLDTLSLDETMQVLDFGAGTGLICGAIAPHVAHVVAVDISQAMLDRLAAKPELAGKVETRCQDITQQPLDERFDLIVSAMALHHVDDTAQLLATFARHLKPDGRIALADLDTEDGSFHPAGTEGVFHQGFDRGALTDLLQKAGLGEVSFTTAATVHKDERPYDIFLVTARKSTAAA